MHQANHISSLVGTSRLCIADPNRCFLRKRCAKYRSKPSAIKCQSDHLSLHHSVQGAIGAGIIGAVLFSSSPSIAEPSNLVDQATGVPEVQLLLRSDSLPAFPTEFPPLPDIVPPPIQKVTLDNGLRVFFLEDHEVPLVKGTLFMRGGQRGSPADRVGVATIAANMQRSGGSLQHPGERMDEELEQRAAYIEGGAGGDATTLGFECLREDVSDVLQLFSEVLIQPVLPQEKLALAKSQALNVIEHRNDDVNGIPRRELAKLLYGKDSVFARNATPQQVQSIQRSDVVSYVETWERPDNAVLGISGDFDREEMSQLIQEKLGKWHPAASQPASPPPIPNSPLPEQSSLGTVYLADRPGLTQANVVMGEVGISLKDDDVYALDLLNDILNSFGGKLFDEVRSKEGLAYTVAGGWRGTPVDHPGLFVAGGQTALPVEFLEALTKVLQEATEVAPTAEELEMAKSETLNSFVFNFASTATQLQRIMVYALLGIPEDYLFQYKAGIEAVTAEDVLAAAKRHLHPKEQSVVLLADAKLVKDELVKRGRTVVPLSLEFE